ncbi:MAG: hypothetical protein GX330_05765, partial [Bacteroidales bacterium]|nr:hypothetical protein [Bacteroidales bacterium]
VDSILIEDTICAGGTYASHNFTIPTEHTLSGYMVYDTNETVNIYGCDSITRIELWVRPVGSVLIEDTICASESYTLYDFNISTTYTTTGYMIYDTNETVNQYGCDSITMLSLWVRPVDSIDFTATVCAGEHYMSNGFDILTVLKDEPYVIYDTNRTTNIEGCDSITTLELTVNPIPEVDLGKDISVCNDTMWPVKLDPGSGYTSYLWNNGARTQVLNATKKGTYFVRVENQYNCYNFDTVEVFDLTDLYVEIESLYDFCIRKQTTLSAHTNASELLWSTGETTSTIMVDEIGVYYVTASERGCKVSDFYIIDTCIVKIYLPNAISPSDRNGQNDYFSMMYPDYYTINNVDLAIYDRWGNQVFASKDPNFRWDGTTSNGRVAHDNVFVYTLVLEIDGVKYKYKGTILVM